MEELSRPVNTKKFPELLAKRFGLTPEVFAKRIFDFRRINGYTLQDLGQILGIGHQTIIRWERMQCFPKSRPIIRRLIDLNII